MRQGSSHPGLSPMKRTTSDPSRSPSRAAPLPVADMIRPTASEPEPLTTGLHDDLVQALRYEALLSDDLTLLEQLLAERPDLPFHLHMNLDMDPGMQATLIHNLIEALPEDQTTPAIVLSGSLPEQVSDDALAQLFTHPTLHSLSLTELLLRSEQVEAIVDAIRQTPSALTSLTYCDDIECVLEPGIRDLISGLPQLRSLELGASSMGSGSVRHDDEDALALAQCLLHMPLEALTLKDFGILMTHLVQQWTPQDSPRWQQLAVHLIGLTPSDDLEVGHLTTFLCRCVSTPSIQTLQLQQFYVDDGDPENQGKKQLQVCPAASRMVLRLTDALQRRDAPLQLELDSGDIGALKLLMTSLSGRPGIRCVHSLHLAYRPTTASLASSCSGQDPAGLFLLAVATGVGALPRLDSLCITLNTTAHPDLQGTLTADDPEASDDASASEASDASSDPHAQPALPPVTPLPVSALAPLAQALGSTHLTSLTFNGRWLTPLPEVLNPCLQRVAAHAIHSALQIQALDLRMGFMRPPMVLPTELGLVVARNIHPDGPTRQLVAQLPALDRSSLLRFVGRYNQLANTAGAAEHPLTVLSTEIRQRMLPLNPQDQPGAAADLR